MNDVGQAIRRATLVGAAIFSLLTALVCSILGCSILMVRAYDVAEMPAFFGVLFLAYALFLLTFAAGLLREREWAWSAGFVAAAIALPFALQSAWRHSWGAMAFDGLYAAGLVGTLVWSRRSGQAP